MLTFLLRFKNKSYIYGLLLILTFILSLPGIRAGDDDKLTPQETIEYYYKQFTQKIKNAPNDAQNEIDNQVLTMIEELFDLNRLASQILQNHWARMNNYEQMMFAEAFKISLHQKILSQIGLDKNKSLPSLKFESIKTNNNVSTLNYLVSFKKKKKELTLYMLKYPDGSWRISNLKTGDKSLMRNYYSYCKKIMGKFSLAYLIAELSNSDHVVLEDFESGEVGKLPIGWLWKKSDEKKNKPYKISLEDGNKYLKAEDTGESVILGKDIKWDLKKYPYISFRWRVHELPEGGDERYGKTVDSAAGIYIVYKKKLGLIPESVKYVWSTTLPVGSTMKRSGIGKPWNIVAESGDEHLGEWRTYVFNAYEAYEKTFGGKPPRKPVGIGILSDANSTHSKAYADYDDIRALKQADVDSGVKQILDAE